jgi:periplasmic protein TonB
MPVRFPDKPVILQDQELIAAADGVAAVMGGTGDMNGSANGGIDGLLNVGPVTLPPPHQDIAKKAAPSAQTTRIQVGGKVQEGKLISGPRPIYPPLALAARIEGTVRLEAVISREGTILNLRAVSGHPLLIPAALAAVQRWVFRPTSLDDDPVEVATTIEVRFTLQK